MIEVGVCCGKGALAYFRYFVESALDTAKNPDDLLFLPIANNGEVAKNYVGKQIRPIQARFQDEQMLGRRGFCHSSILNELVTHFTTPKAIISDCDVVMLKRGWDGLLLSKLDDTCVAIGTEYAAHVDMPQKYLGFPNCVFCLMDWEKIRPLNVNFMLLGDKTVTGKIAEFFGRRDGDTIFIDTSGEFPLKVKLAGYTGVPLTCVLQGDPGAQVLASAKYLRGLARSMYPQEYHLDGEPILVHFGKSENREFGLCPVVREVRKSIEAR